MNHYIIGDIHGEYDTLVRLIEKLPNDAKLIFVGDLIDRGPKSAEVQPHFVNVDTGCYMPEHGYGMLSAYCVETGEVVNVRRRES